jgi:hypothetical protein
MTEDRECPGQRNGRVCYRADPTRPNHTPGILRRILGFTVAAAQHVAAGMPTVTEAQKAARLAICQACDQFNADAGTCRKCGCGMSTKAEWAGSACPLRKWGPIEAAQDVEAPALVT